MAKKTLTQSTVATNNIQNQPDQVVDQSTALKLAFDQYGIDSKTYNNVTLLVELADESVSNSGSNTIGHNSTTVTADNVGDALEENAQAISGAILGQIPNNTLTEVKMAAEMKKQADGVAKYNDLEGLRIQELDTGIADAYVVTTVGPFVRVDGNTLPFIPANNNTGASTINEDGNGVTNVKKYVDGAWIALEEGDLKKFQQVQLVWNASESAFQLAPKGGATFKSPIQRGIGQLFNVSEITINVSSVDMTDSVILLSFETDDLVGLVGASMAVPEPISSTQFKVKRGVNPGNGKRISFSWELLEYSNAIVQRGITSTAGSDPTQSITTVDLDKSFLVAHPYVVSPAVSDVDYSLSKDQFLDDSTLKFTTTVQGSIYWQAVELK